MNAHKELAYRFFLLVLAPALVATVGIALVMIYLLSGVVRQVNNLDREYAVQAAAAAVGAMVERMTITIGDNANWDDAVRRIYGTMDAAWVEETWGVIPEVFAYDSLFIVDDKGKTLAAFVRGQKATVSVEQYFGRGLETLLRKLPTDTETFRTSAGILQNQEDISVVAAAPILPSSDDLAIPQARPDIMIIGKRLDAETLASMGKQHAFDGLRLTPPTSKVDDELALQDPNGATVAKLTWDTRRPGDKIRARLSSIAMSLIACLTLVMGGLMHSNWRALRNTVVSEERASYNSLHDELSGLPNRRLLLSQLAAHLSTVRLAKKPLAIVYADLDGFKEVNDAHGHDIGDQLICAAAAGFQSLAGENALVARLGGDEFAIVIDSPSAAADALHLADAMIGFLREPFDFDGRSISVGTSIGLVALKHRDVDAAELLRRADLAMYAAKARGRNRVCHYDPQMDEVREGKRMIAAALKLAIDNGALGIAYQPVVDTSTMTIIGIEALARWPTDSSENFAPDHFVKIAEECGLIDDLGRYVLMGACRQAALWPGLSISVNVSPLQFKNPAFTHEVSQIVAMTGIGRDRLELEVTEGAVIENVENAAAVIERLHELGVRVALDDFGTGHSSLGNLRKFQFDRLKLDRSLVKDILLSPSALRLLQATVVMADSLGLPVTAEGVEHREQVPLLRLAGVRSCQGFLFSKPMQAAEVTAVLEEAAAFRRAASESVAA